MSERTVRSFRKNSNFRPSLQIFLDIGGQSKHFVRNFLPKKPLGHNHGIKTDFTIYYLVSSERVYQKKFRTCNSTKWHISSCDITCRTFNQKFFYHYLDKYQDLQLKKYPSGID